MDTIDIREALFQLLDAAREFAPVTCSNAFDLCGFSAEEIREVRSFEQAGLSGDGLLLSLENGDEFQITIARRR